MKPCKKTSFQACLQNTVSLILSSQHDIPAQVTGHMNLATTACVHGYLHGVTGFYMPYTYTDIAILHAC